MKSVTKLNRRIEDPKGGWLHMAKEYLKEITTSTLVKYVAPSVLCAIFQEQLEEVRYRQHRTVRKKARQKQ